MNTTRARPSVRGLLRRGLIRPTDLVMPLLVREDAGSAPRGLLRILGVEELRSEVAEIVRLGIPGVKLFAAPSRRDAMASQATQRGGVMWRAICTIKDAAPDLCVLVETCLCSYTDSGECVLRSMNGDIDYEGTYAALAEMAVLQARAGADVIGPAVMLDGSVAAVRCALDSTGQRALPVMPHLIFDAVLYGLYREALGASQKGPASAAAQTSRRGDASRGQATPRSLLAATFGMATNFQ